MLPSNLGGVVVALALEAAVLLGSIHRGRKHVVEGLGMALEQLQAAGIHGFPKHAVVRFRTAIALEPLRMVVDIDLQRCKDTMYCSRVEEHPLCAVLLNDLDLQPT